MKKKFSLLTLCLAFACSGFAFELGWSGSARVRGGATVNEGYDKDSSTKSWRSQRVQLLMEGKTEDNIQLQLEVNWGDGDPSEDDNKNVALDKAYIVAPNFIPGVSLSAGYQPFCANNGMVLDDNFLGYQITKNFDQKATLSLAMFLIGKGNTDKESANDDSHGVLATVSNADGTIGLDMLAHSNCLPEIEAEFYDKDKQSMQTFSSADNYKRGTLLWFSPYYNLSGSQFGLDALKIFFNATYLTGSWDAKEDADSKYKELELSAYAFSLKPSYDCSCGTTIAFDLFYSSGSDAETTSEDGEVGAFRGISPAYSNGLEYFGDGGPTDNSVINLGASTIDGENANNYGALMAALVVDHPLSQKIKAHAALGWANTSEDVIWAEDGKKKSSRQLGTEIDLGFSYQATPSLALSVTGVCVAPGEASYQDGNNDNILQIGSYLEYAF